MNFNPKALLAIGILSVAGIGSMAQAQDIKPVSFQQASTIAQLSSAIGAQPGAIKNAPVEGVAFKINASGVECLVNAKDAPDLNTLYQQNNNVARCMVGLIGQQDIADAVKELAAEAGLAQEARTRAVSAITEATIRLFMVGYSGWMIKIERRLRPRAHSRSRRKR